MTLIDPHLPLCTADPDEEPTMALNPPDVQVHNLTVDLTTAAQLFLMVESLEPAAIEQLNPTQLAAGEAARTMWCGLVGMDAEAAVELAQRIVADPSPVRAAVVPF